MIRKAGLLLCSVAIGYLLCASAASAASYGLKELSVQFEEEGNTAATQAGGHPYQLTTSFGLDTEMDPDFGEITLGSAKDLQIHMPTGMVGDPTAVRQCTGEQFAKIIQAKKLPSCPNDTAVGVGIVRIGAERVEYQGVPVYNLVPLQGEVARFGIIVYGVPVTVDLKVSETAPYEVVASLPNVSQAVRFYGSTVFIWGNPASSDHDTLRGSCVKAAQLTETPEIISEGSCNGGEDRGPFLTSPRACVGPLSASFRSDSWQNPEVWFEESIPASSGFNGCDQLKFQPSTAAAPTTDTAESESGLNFELSMDNPGLTETNGMAGSDIEKAVVALPEGVTTNPAVAAGLQACTLAQYEEQVFGSAGGCPEGSKIGMVEVESPLLSEERPNGELVPEVIPGRIYVAHQHDNVFNNLLTIYMVIEDPKLGLFLKLPGRVEPNPSTGQLTTTFGEPGFEIPQLPFSHFRLHFRSGNRAPLITPPTCGTFTSEALLYPYANPGAPVPSTASFSIGSGAGGGACASSAAQLPNKQSFSAGTENPKAGAYSPFILMLSREDGTQQLRSISATLPPGLIGKLAGIPYCSDAQIAQAAGRGGEGEGGAELGSPSCPQASEVGTATVGAGAGGELLYVTGHAYLAGPYKGAPLSLEIVTPAIAGPFDLGVVAVRTALNVNPLTTQITAESDPIPTILHGLPLDVRSIAIEMNRHEFTLNPTSCEPKSITASVTSTFGASNSLSQYFQATECAALSFSPKLKIKFGGSMKRLGNPSITATLSQPAGQSGISSVVTVLPPSEFIDNAHINNPCTRVQFAAHECPPKSVLGTAKAWSPLLDQPLEGPVYFRSNGGERKLPDLVADLNGQIHVELVGFIDSQRHKGSDISRVRTRFLNVPDAPVSKFSLSLYGGKRGLLENTENLCHGKHVAQYKMAGQNGRTHDFNEAIATTCKSKKPKPKPKKKKGK
jgi:hypothetical protein